MKKLTIYCARPISGRNGQEIIQYYRNIQKTLEMLGYNVLHPMVAKGYLSNDIKMDAAGYTQPISTNKAIFNRDRWMVKTADVVYMDLSMATQASIGCISELTISYENGKHSILVLPNGNIHEHAFILEMAGIIFQTEHDALQYLQHLSSQSISNPPIAPDLDMGMPRWLKESIDPKDILPNK